MTDSTARNLGSARQPQWPTAIVVGPDATRRCALSQLLALIGCQVREATELQSACAKIPCEQKAIILLDVREDDARGIADIRLARSLYEQLPIVVVCLGGQPLTAARALEAGATDFLADPFYGREFLARCWRVVCARRDSNEEVSVGPLSIDFDQHSVMLNGRLLDLTRSEFAILSHLARRPNSVVPDEEIVADVLGSTYTAHCSILRAHLCRLRRKLGGAHWMIQTVHGQGHRLRDRCAPFSRPEQLPAFNEHSREAGGRK